MFGNMMGLMDQAQKQMGDIKKKLDDVLVEAQSEGGLVKVKATANKRITNITISQELLDTKDIEELEDLVMVAINRALDKADEISSEQLQGEALNILPNLQNLF